jgi:hypothetical protein
MQGFPIHGAGLCITGTTLGDRGRGCPATGFRLNMPNPAHEMQAPHLDGASQLITPPPDFVIGDTIILRR